MAADQDCSEECRSLTGGLELGRPEMPAASRGPSRQSTTGRKNSASVAALNGRAKHAPGPRCVSDSTRDDLYDAAGSTIVVTLLILSPPIVLIGVILLTTGAIISRMFVLVAGLATILCGVLVAAITAFVFVRMRGGTANTKRKNSANAPGAPSHGHPARARRSDSGVGSGGCSRDTTAGAPGRGNYYRVTMDLERSTNSADGSFRVEITEQPTTMVAFFSSADSDLHSTRGSKTEGSDSNGSMSSNSGSTCAIGIKRVTENTHPG